MNQRLAIQATRDGLTGLLNRREADDCLRRQISRARRTNDLLSCAIIDIDGFKHVNDTAGHVAGDAVIRHVAHTLLGVMRDEDHVFRIGGDEFLVVFPCTGTEGTALAMERLRKTIEQTAIEVEGWKIQVKVTVGVAGFTSGIGNHEDFLREADLALYAAKQAGRNRVLIQAA